MFEELETVELTHDIKKHGLKEGDIGAIVNIYNDGKAYEVEFVAPNGRTIALLTLMPDEIRPYMEHENIFSSFRENVPISLGTVSGMTLNTIVNKDELKITTETFKSKIEEFRYPIGTP